MLARHYLIMGGRSWPPKIGAKLARVESQLAWGADVKKDLISIDDLGLEQILDYLDLAARWKRCPTPRRRACCRGRSWRRCSRA
jgi:hypothetical protein